MSSLTEAEARGELAVLGKLGPLKGRITNLVAALRRQVALLTALYIYIYIYICHFWNKSGQSKQARVAPHAVGSIYDHASL